MENNVDVCHAVKDGYRRQSQITPGLPRISSAPFLTGSDPLSMKYPSLSHPDGVQVSSHTLVGVTHTQANVTSDNQRISSQVAWC
jgi:hypothetical protein